MYCFLISIIVPVYKVEKYLDRCVESIVNQTYTNLEIILVDDGSPDNCPQMCDAWAKKDSRIKVIHKENGGVSSARNVGLDCANGDYIAFVDSDDYCDAKMYENLLCDVVREKAEIAECSIIRESPNGYREIWKATNLDIETQSRDQALIHISSTLELVCIHTANKLYSKKAIGEVRFDETLRYCEDTLFNYQTTLNINKKVLSANAYYHFYYNINSATMNRVPLSKFDEQKVVDKIYEITPANLMEYSVRGDVLKTINKIKEVCVDGSASRKEYFWLRKRISKYNKNVLFSNKYTLITKLKYVMLMTFPNLFKLINIIYGKNQIKKQRKKYLN